LETPQTAPHISWPKFHDGFADALITEDGYIGMVWVYGDYPVSIEPSFFRGKYLDDLQDFVEGLAYLKEAICNTIRTGCGVTVHGTIKGQRRIGMTLFVNHIYAILRLFAQRS
jgi:hypothetical protein